MFDSDIYEPSPRRVMTEEMLPQKYDPRWHSVKTAYGDVQIMQAMAEEYEWEQSVAPFATPLTAKWDYLENMPPVKEELQTCRIDVYEIGYRYFYTFWNVPGFCSYCTVEWDIGNDLSDEMFCFAADSQQAIFSCIALILSHIGESNPNPEAYDTGFKVAFRKEYDSGEKVPLPEKKEKKIILTDSGKEKVRSMIDFISSSKETVQSFPVFGHSNDTIVFDHVPSEDECLQMITDGEVNGLYKQFWAWKDCATSQRLTLKWREDFEYELGTGVFVDFNVQMKITGHEHIEIPAHLQDEKEIIRFILDRLKMLPKPEYVMPTVINIKPSEIDWENMKITK